jgi:hypothetical protein
MKRVILAIMFLLFAYPLSASAKVINSDPHFVREGRPGYDCVAPDGTQVRCNEWLLEEGRGWQKKCTESDRSPFKQLESRSGQQIDIPPTKKGCAMLFDKQWGDRRNTSREELSEEELEAEMLRPLKEAYFEQHVEVKKQGLYELRSCMAFHTWNEPEPWTQSVGVQNQGGIRVTLEKWLADGKRLRAFIPDKARFGPVDNLIEGGYRIQAAPTFDDIEFEPWFEYGTLDENIVWTIEKGRENLALGFVADGMANYFIDGYDGHVGLHSAYQTYYKEDAVWTCHTQEVTIWPGMYTIRAEVLPYIHYNDYCCGYKNPPWTVTDYDGFGGIRVIKLIKK